MLRVNTPNLSINGVKAFAKTLRQRNRDDDVGTVANLLADLINHSPERLVPLNNGHFLGMSSVAWIIGTCGTGKTELARSLALLAMRNPKRRVCVLNDQSNLEASHWEEIGFTVAPPTYASNPTHPSAIGQYTVLQATPIERSLEDYNTAFELDLAALSETDLSDTTILIDRKLNTFPSTSLRLRGVLNRIRASERANITLASQDESCRTYRDCLNWRTDDVITLNGAHAEHYGHIRSAEKSKTFLMDAKSVNAHDSVEFLRSFSQAQISTYVEFADYLANQLKTEFDSSTHTKALGVSAHWLGFRSWHSLEGNLKNGREKDNKSAPLTTEEVLKAMVVVKGYDVEDSDMWMDRTISTLEVLEVAKIDIRAPDLFNALLAKQDHPEVAKYLDTLPHYRSNPEKAAELFGYSTMMAVGPAIDMYGPLEG